MTKRQKSKYGVCKKIKNEYKNLWGLKNKNSFRSLSRKRVNKKFKRTTRFSKLLNIKQSLKSFYPNISESTFKNLVRRSIDSSSKIIHKLTSATESRIDSILFRSCLVTSFFQARQLINHKFVLVNNIIISNHSQIINKGDIISFNTSNFNFSYFTKILSSRSIPNFIEIDFKNLAIVFLWDPKFAYYPVYTRHKYLYRYYK
jgi:ribosomal protein S4